VTLGLVSERSNSDTEATSDAGSKTQTRTENTQEEMMNRLGVSCSSVHEKALSLQESFNTRQTKSVGSDIDSEVS